MTVSQSPAAANNDKPRYCIQDASIHNTVYPGSYSVDGAAIVSALYIINVI